MGAIPISSFKLHFEPCHPQDVFHLNHIATLRGATLAGGRQHLDSDAAHVPVRGDAPSRAPLRRLVLQAARLFDDMLQVVSHLHRRRTSLLSKKGGSKRV